MSDNTSTEPHKSKPKLIPRHGWFRLYRADIARIRECGESNKAAVSTPVLIAVWAALCDLANEKHAPTFEAGVGAIRIRAGVSRRTAFAALRVLESKLGMVSRTNNKADATTLEENTWTILETSASGAPCKRRTTPSAKEVPQNSHRGIKKSLSGSSRKEKEASSPVAGLAAAGAPQSPSGEKGDPW